MNNVIVSIKLCLGVGNDEYILCRFVGRFMSGFKVSEGGLQSPLPPGHRKQKKALSE